MSPTLARLLRTSSLVVADRSSGRRRLMRSGHHRFQLESLECRRLLAADLATPELSPVPPELLGGIVQGRKWEDLNRNGRQDGNEPGLPGVTIYADLNWNGRRDRSEPRTVTQQDIPETDFDEAGLYVLQNVPPGQQLIREVVPRGYEQTYPLGIAVPLGPDEVPADEAFARVEPPLLEIPLSPGETFVEQMAIVIEPLCFRPYEIDVIASDRSVKLENMSGVQLNGCGGDVSQFEIAFTTERFPLSFEIQFVDAQFGSLLGAIPVFGIPEPIVDGGHVVKIDPGGSVDGINFGNARRPSGAIEGRKWLDRNGDGRWDAAEPGWGGVTIFADLNGNGLPDRGEPRSVTAYDNPDTDFDEAGLYQLSGLEPGDYLVREVVPRNRVQTFPGPGGAVIDSENGRMNDGVALDLNVTDVAASLAEEPMLVDAQIELTVVWPDSCGTIIDSETSFTVVGNNIVIELQGQQVGDACAEVISPQPVQVEVADLSSGRYQVVAVLHESLPGGPQDVPTLTAVASIAVGGPGAHRVSVEENQLVSDINFGNRPTVEPGAIEGLKWSDLNGDGQRDSDEPNLAGVVIYADLNGNRRREPNEPTTRTRRDDPDTPEDETGQYELTGLRPGRYSIREVVPDGSRQTYPTGGSKMLKVDSNDLPPGGAISFDLTDVEADPAANGVWGAVLTFDVVWPNGCYSLIDDATSVDFGEDIVNVELTGARIADICTQALVTQTVAIHVPNVGEGEYIVEAVLNEKDLEDDVAVPSFVLHAEVTLSRRGEHVVTVSPGENASGFDFGNQIRKRLAPDEVLILADLDRNGELNANDIDLLAAAIRGGDPETNGYDLSGDGQLDHRDLERMVIDLMQTRFGDANLDGVFDSSDLVQVLQAGEFQDDIKGNSSWEEGDWDGDGDFTTSDLILALQGGQ